MTDDNREQWIQQIAEDDVKKGLVPDQGVLPPINLPQPTNTSKSDPSPTSSDSGSNNSSSKK